MDIVVGFAVGVLIVVWALMAVIVVRYICKKRKYKVIVNMLDDDYCMCGDLVSSHNFGSGHAPIGQLDYFMGTTKKPKYE